MRIAQVLENLQNLIPIELAVVVLLVTIPLLLLALILLKRPFLFFVIFAMGGAAAVRFGAIAALGLVGRYFMIAGLTAVALAHRSRSPWTFTESAYLLCISLVSLQALRAPSLGDAAVRVVVYFLSFPAFIVLTRQICMDDVQFRRTVNWLLAWSILIVWIQIPLMDYVMGRPTGIFVSVPGLQNSMMFAIVILVYAMMSGVSKGRWLCLLLPTLITACGLLLMSGGRTSILTAAFALPFVFRLRPGKTLLVGTAVAGIAFLVLSHVLPQSEAFQSIVPHLLSTDTSGRLALWNMLWQGCLEMPIFGHGLDQSLVYTQTEVGMQGHSTYLQLAYDCGIPTAAIVFVLLMLCALSMWHTVAKAPQGPIKQTAALGGALLMTVLVPTFASHALLSLDINWFILCMSLGMLIAARQRMKEAEGVDTEDESSLCEASAVVPVEYGGKIYGY